jgi:putative two-component system response regulator
LPSRLILVVDDDAQIRQQLVSMLRPAGFPCDEAGTVDEARARIAEHEPILVLLAVNIPGESGLHLARELAARRPALVVIMISRADDTEVARIALDTGAYGYITKPFKRNEIVIAVTNALHRRSAEIESRTYRGLLEDRLLERTAVAEDALLRLHLAHEETVMRLSKAIEFRDRGSGGHIERMSQYCALLAAPFGLDVDTMRIASRLHDVGKIAVADSILLKPGLLTPDERAQMQRHAEMGYELLRGSRSELLDVAATIAWTHHEWFDGNGYPVGLRGEEIPLCGRIAAVADVFDALNTDRVFRSRLPRQQSVGMLRDGRGGHFDPSIVDAFLSRMDEVESIIARFEDMPELPHAAAADEPATLVSMKDAAAALGVSASTMRRLADEGRIPSVRTTGGHRRFALQALRDFAAEQGAPPSIRPTAAPDERIPSLAAHLQVHGADLVARAVTAVYRGAKPGWFASDDAAVEIHELLEELASSAQSGHYDGVLDAADGLSRRARLHGVSVLERHTFLERLGEVVVRSLGRAGTGQEELAVTRHLFVTLRETMLDRSS